VLLSLVGVLFITVMDFTSVIDLLNLLFCFSQAIEFVAYLKLKAEYVYCDTIVLLPSFPV
jgi:hypothetical protein